MHISDRVVRFVAVCTVECVRVFILLAYEIICTYVRDDGLWRAYIGVAYRIISRFGCISLPIVVSRKHVLAVKMHLCLCGTLAPFCLGNSVEFCACKGFVFVGVCIISVWFDKCFYERISRFFKSSTSWVHNQGWAMILIEKIKIIYMLV